MPPRISKPKTASDAAAVPAVPEVSVAPAAVKVEKPKKAKVTKTDAELVSVSTPTPVVSTLAPTVVEDVVVAPAVEDVEASIAAQSVEFMAKLNQFSSLVASLKSEYRNLEKKWTRELKAAQKSSSKKKKRAGNRAPSGFVKPTKISDELASFLGKDKGSEMARTDVTREINKYIRSHNLQDAGNGRKINPDQKLQTLLKLKKTDELTYFNLQRYMSPHFQKAEKAVLAAAAAATVSA
jgi:hypothetical protein